MKPITTLLISAVLLFQIPVRAQTAQTTPTPTKSSIPYVENADQRQVLDIYAPPNAKDLPVVFWIHGGGWQAGDKSDVKLKPQWFMDRGFVFVSINYRLWPAVDMATLHSDVAKSFGWVHKHIAEYGGNPQRILVGGHSAGAQLAAILCTDDRYLKSEGFSFDVLLGCVPVDGDTYDIPAMIETAETRLRVHGFPPPKQGHRIKFGETLEKQNNFSAVTHIAKGKGIPPFLILYVNDHPDTSIQARRLDVVLKEAAVSSTLYGAKETNHNRLNDELGVADDPATKALAEFVEKVTRK